MQNIDLLEVFRRDSCVVKNAEKFKELKTKTSNARIKSTQDPEELRQFLQYLGRLSVGINNYLEVGCSGGGTFYFIVSFLSSVNKNFSFAVANDIRDKLREFDNFKSYMGENNVNVSKLIVNSHLIKPDKTYDLVFVDANHTFEGVIKDYITWKDHAKYLAFHDISYKGEKRMCGVPSAWMLIKQNYSYYKEFVNLNSVYNYPQGIGLIYTETKIKNPDGTDKNGKWWQRYIK